MPKEVISLSENVMVNCIEHCTKIKEGKKYELAGINSSCNVGENLQECCLSRMKLNECKSLYYNGAFKENLISHNATRVTFELLRHEVAMCLLVTDIGCFERHFCSAVRAIAVDCVNE